MEGLSNTAQNLSEDGRQTNRYSALPLGLTYVVTCMVFLSNLKLSLYTHEGMQGRLCTAQLVLNIGTTRRRVVKVTPRPLYLRKRTPVTIKHEDIGAPRVGLDGFGQKENHFSLPKLQRIFQPVD